MQGELYTDLDLTFKPDPVTGDVGVAKNSDCIKNSVFRIISLDKFDIPFNGADYSSLKRLLFEAPSHATYAMITQSVELLIQQLEPRIKIQSIDIDYDEVNSEYNVDIKYLIIKTNTEEVLTKTIERIR